MVKVSLQATCDGVFLLIDFLKMVQLICIRRGEKYGGGGCETIQLGPKSTGFTDDIVYCGLFKAK